MFKKVLLAVMASVICSHAFAAWDFRGEPNSWGSTRLTAVVGDANKFVIRQTFSTTQDEFKIAKDAAWTESYPAQNFKVAAGKTYDITFFQNTHAIQVVEVIASSSSSSKISSSSSSVISSVSSKSSSSSSRSSSIVSSSSATSEKWLFRGTTNSWGINTPMTKSGNVFVTCQDFAANDPRFKISNGNKLTPTTWVEAYPAQDLRVAVNTSFDITFDSKTKAITTVPRTSLCGSIDPERSLIIHDEATLNFSDAVGPVFGLKRVLTQLANQLNAKNPAHPTSARELFARMWDSQNTPANAVYSDGPKCTGILNGFPSECRLAEGEQARAPDEAMSNYIPIALVNRFDLHDKNFNNCGEYRIIYAVKNVQGRNFIAFESQITNPVKTDRKMCLPIVNFWKQLTIENSTTARAQLLADFYLKGLPSSGSFQAINPVVDIANLSGSTGQIRTNEFMGSSWLLKEFKVVVENNLSFFKPVSLKENPFGQLFNDLSPDAFSTQFRTQFVNNMGSLITSDLATTRLTVENDAHNSGQAHVSGDTSDDDYLNWANRNQGTSAFKAAIQTKTVALGSSLTADQVINRATAASCAGCHNPQMFNLTSDSSVGPNQSWPESLGFTHISEFAVGGAFPISPALQEVFLPSRKSGMESYLKSFDPASASSAP